MVKNLLWPFVGAVASLTIATTAHAQLGWTLDQCEKVYGMPVGSVLTMARQNYFTFRAGNYTVSCSLKKGVVTTVTYWKANRAAFSPAERKDLENKTFPDWVAWDNNSKTTSRSTYDDGSPSDEGTFWVRSAPNPENPEAYSVFGYTKDVNGKESVIMLEFAQLEPAPSPTPSAAAKTADEANGWTDEVKQRVFGTPTPKPQLNGKTGEAVIVENMSDSDATHIYLGPTTEKDLNKAEDWKYTYDDNPKAFAQGWKDGWNWAQKQSGPTDDAAEKVEKKLYGNIDNEPGQTKALAFDFAESVVRALHDRSDYARGPLPETDGLWGVSLYVHDAIKKELADPDSYKYVGLAVRPSWVKHNGQFCYYMEVRFRAKNRAGGYAFWLADVYLLTLGDGTERVLDVEIKD